jgi:hypothetical protein
MCRVGGVNEQTVQPFCQRREGALSASAQSVKVGGAVGLVMGGGLGRSAITPGRGRGVIIITSPVNTAFLEDVAPVVYESALQVVSKALPTAQKTAVSTVFRDYLALIPLFGVSFSSIGVSRNQRMPKNRRCRSR